MLLTGPGDPVLGHEQVTVSQPHLRLLPAPSCSFQSAGLCRGCCGARKGLDHAGLGSGDTGPAIPLPRPWGPPSELPSAGDPWPLEAGHRVGGEVRDFHVAWNTRWWGGRKQAPKWQVGRYSQRVALFPGVGGLGQRTVPPKAPSVHGDSERPPFSPCRPMRTLARLSLDTTSAACEPRRPRADGHQSLGRLDGLQTSGQTSLVYQLNQETYNHKIEREALL